MQFSLFDQLVSTACLVASQTTLLAVAFAALVSLPVSGLISGYFPSKKPQKYAFSVLFCIIGIGALCGAGLTFAGFALPFQHDGSGDPAIAILSAYFWLLCSILAFIFSVLEYVLRNSEG